MLISLSLCISTHIHTYIGYIDASMMHRLYGGYYHSSDIEEYALQMEPYALSTVYLVTDTDSGLESGSESNEESKHHIYREEIITYEPAVVCGGIQGTADGIVLDNVYIDSGNPLETLTNATETRVNQETVYNNTTNVTTNTTDTLANIYTNKIKVSNVPKLFCGIFTTHEKHGNIRAILSTWGWKCDGFVAFSTKNDPSLNGMYMYMCVYMCVYV